MKLGFACGLLCAVIVLMGCHGPAFNLPPAEYLMAPGPGVDGPGPGVLGAADYSGMMAQGDSGAPSEYCSDSPMPTVQVLFASPAGMHVHWDITGSGGFDGTPLVVPARTNFDQAGLYRCKLTNIPGHEGVELYPTVEVGTPTPSTLAFISHNAIPVQLTSDDFNQVTAGNFVTKVLYLPDPDFQYLAVAGVETLVSTRLDPGIDPVVEADRRGSILAIVRIGNKDIEMPGEQFREYYSATLNAQGEVIPASYTQGCGSGDVRNTPPIPDRVTHRSPCGPHPGGAMTCRRSAGPSAMVPPSLANVPTIPAAHLQRPSLPGYGSVPYGMPITGTPIGLPGPPHIPLGGPAGLRKHVIVNHTHTYIPNPTHKIDIHVKQSPPVHYPAPRERAFIHQYNHPTCAHCTGAGP